MYKVKPFRDWSIRRKLAALFLAMATITAVTVSVSIGAFDLIGLKASMGTNLSILADVLGQNSAAALTFQDADAAQNVLNALHAHTSVTAACIYTNEGKPFAIYVREDKKQHFVPPPVQQQQTYITTSKLIIVRTIVFGGDRIGTIYIESDLQPLQHRVQEYIIANIVTALLTILLAFLIIPRLQQPISRPLIQLTKTAEAISTAANYSLRADLSSKDEFGRLGIAFNDMLDQIETRDRELRLHREHLEEEVASRTAELFEASARLKLQAEALNAASNSILITDTAGNIVWSNPAFSKSSGYASDEVLGMNQSLLSSDEQDSKLRDRMWATIAKGETWHGEMVSRRKNDGIYTEEVTVTPVLSQSGEITNYVAIKNDITDRKLAEQALSEAEEKYRAIFEDAVIGIFQISADGRPISINRAFAKIHGYESPSEFLAQVSNISRQLFVDPSQSRLIVREAQTNGIVQGAEIEVYRKDGAKRWVIANLRVARNSLGEVALYEGTVEDVTERKVAEERVQFLAFYDVLTGLPNRSLLEDRISIALAGARRRKEKLAFLFLDLDRFKIVNDTLGHSVGDLLLQEVAERLKKFVREQDTVARVGGDEFVIMLSGIQSISDASVAAARLIELIAIEFPISNNVLSVTSSVGISMYPENGADGETLVKNADAAMYSAKQKGPNNFEFFTEDLNVQMKERLTLESGLRQAIEKQELFLAYQPQMDLISGKIVGVEALLRWQHPELGLVPPDKFISIAENSGLIIPIGEWALRTACAQARKWQDEGLAAVPIAVNVSAVQFRQDGFRDLIKNVLHDTGLAPEFLELELTESLLLTNADVMFSVLRELNEMGLQLAIDDFGTGYSSLSYLKQFPVKKLKIDRSFIKNVAVNASDAAITTAIIGMARSLGLKVIAEGVENDAQVFFLREHRCDEVQGYYFSKPISATELGLKFLAVQDEMDVRAPLSADVAGLFVI
jgi:diguanylate cyclase (GGDEF)-like protein/PAS domain S-box-containing protein